jgi:DNA-binding XRE family transcriptional regulator
VPVLVFRSVHPGRSFEFWLFRRQGPEIRRLVTAFATAFLPLWDISPAERRRARRHGPGLFQLRITCAPPARRPRGGAPGRERGPDLAVSVFFLRQDQATILLSGSVVPADARFAWPVIPGLREARRCLRELREAEQTGHLHGTLALDIFEEIESRGARTLHPPPTVARLTPAEPELLALGGLREAVVREALRDGPAAVRELEDHDDRLATAAQVLWARLAARLTQRDLATGAGVRQYQLSRIENGCADPTLATLGRLARALDTELRIGVGGPAAGGRGRSAAVNSVTPERAGGWTDRGGTPPAPSGVTPAAPR